MIKKKILILGGNGMLGNALLLSFLNNTDKFIVKATIRNNKKKLYEKQFGSHLFYKCDFSNFNQIEKIIDKFNPDYLVNCIGITNKKISKYLNHYIFKINTFLPIYLSQLSEIKNFKFIHISTDCVFDGKKKIYFEDSFKTAKDIYGVSKYLLQF